ncbi:MAG: hypothetical protein P4M09_21565 [Devosia sp.]|nr:hypothetical protein [Devosia sp.]
MTRATLPAFGDFLATYGEMLKRQYKTRLNKYIAALMITADDAQSQLRRLAMPVPRGLAAMRHDEGDVKSGSQAGRRGSILPAS